MNFADDKSMANQPEGGQTLMNHAPVRQGAVQVPGYRLQCTWINWLARANSLLEDALFAENRPRS